MMAEEQEVQGPLSNEAEPEANEPGAGAEEQEPNVEAEARRMGWKPKEEFDGPEDQWVSAEDFVKKQDEDAAVAISTNKKLRARLNKLERDFEERNRYFDMQLQAERQRIKEEYDTKLREAVERGDVEEYDKIVKQREKAVEQPVKEAQEQSGGQAQSPEDKEAIARFESETPWYGVDEEMTVAAQQASDRLAATAPNMTTEAHLKKVRDIVERGYPDRVKGSSGGEDRRQGSPVAGGRRQAGGGKKAETYDNMPSESRQACDRMVKRGVCSQEEFVKNYYAFERSQS